VSTGGLIVGFIIVAAFVLWVVLPFVRREDLADAAPESTVERQRERLLVYYQRVLRNLHDIDEDYATGKLNEDEYTVEREAWVQRGVQVLKALDSLDAQHLVAPASADNAAVDEAIETSIEAALEAREQQAV